MTNTKNTKQLVILIGLVVLIVGVLYFGFFKKSAPTPTETVVGVSDVPVSGIGTKDDLGFLSKPLDTKILDDSRFKALTPPNYPSVTVSELGLKNPFTGEQ
jgi:hypothetical protein